MPRILAVLLFLGVTFGINQLSAAIGAQAGSSGRPLPRFVSLAVDEANMRTGPGRQYPKIWVYKRSMLPLEVIGEHGPWRQVRDHEGITGWMHVSLLSSRRTAMILGSTRRLYQEKTPASPTRVIADKGVVGHILECEGIWCRMEIDDLRGWVERRYLWGVYEREVIE